LEDFEGTWMTATMDKVFEAGIQEQVADIAAGRHPSIEQMSVEEAKKILVKSPEAAVMLEMMKELQVRMGFTISPPNKLIVILESKGEREEIAYPAEFEITSKELVCRYEVGPTLLEFEGENLRTRNDEKQSYPKYLTLIRETQRRSKSQEGNRD
tara:strand:+ start:711 stop:1175 length:465 start_codon:yes stop_codon:yes gene_type:complete